LHYTWLKVYILTAECCLSLQKISMTFHLNHTTSPQNTVMVTPQIWNNYQSAITLHMLPTISTMFQIHAEWYSVNVLDSLWKRSKFFEFEDSYPPTCNAMPLGEWLPTSRRNIVPSPSGSSSLRSSSLKQSRMTALPWIWTHYVPLKYQDPLSQWPSITIGSRFATVHFKTIHFYDSCWVGPSNPDLWYVTVAPQASFP
jgi:hypothetical protein